MLDTVFIFCLALIIFGPKKLPEIGRQIGKLMLEFRRASNDFKMQIEEELRASEQAEQQKQISAPASVASAASSEAPASGYEPTREPVIQPPAEGSPVRHTFASASSETVSQPTYEAAFPEAASAFESSTNGALAEMETISAVPFATHNPTPVNAGPADAAMELPAGDPAHSRHG